MNSKFTQLCIWPGTLLGDNTPEEFEKFFEEQGFKVKFSEEVETLPDVKDGRVIEGTGGRHDLFFHIHSDDIDRFAIFRLQYGIRWWEDVLGNGESHLYPQSVLDRYPATW